MTKLKLYSDCEKYGFLPFKEKYTLRDANNAQIDSLFRTGGTISLKEAKWLCKCSAVYHGSNYSKAIN